MSESLTAPPIISDAPPPMSNPPGGADNQPPMPDAPFVSMQDRIKTAAADADAAIRALAEGRDPRQPDAPPPAGNPSQDSNTPANPPQPSPVPQIPPQGDSSEELRRMIAQAENDARTWRGRAEAEQKRANEEIARLKAALEEATHTKAKDALAEALGQQTGATPEEIETYGEQMLSVVSRYVMPQVRDLLNKAIEGLRAEFAEGIKPVAGKVEAVVLTAEQQRDADFARDLTTAIPNWREIDVSPEFTAWLNEEDPISGLIRRSALDTHVQNRNAARVAVIFNAFLGQRGGVPGQQPPGGGSSQLPAGGNAPGSNEDRQPSLADLAAPGGSRRQSDATEAGGAGQPKVWTRQEINEFYQKVGRGQYRDNPVERDRIEREIATAQRQGRVRE